MAKLRVTIKGNLGQISASAFVSVIGSCLWILRDLDKRISESRQGSLKWVISGLGEGSAKIELESKPMQGKRDYSPRVANAFTDGLNIVRERSVTPELFSTDIMERLRIIVREFRRDGFEGIGFHTPELDKSAQLTRDTGKDIEILVGVHHKAVGSVEGKIELISVHRGYRRFNLYHAITQKAIKCNMPSDIETEVFKAAEERRRVIVSGIISYNIRGEPISVIVERPIRFLKKEEELPTIEEICGLDREITGNFSTEEYIRSLRDG